MLLKLDNVKLLTESISLLSELVLEAKAKINKEGFEITALDPANVALVVLKIPAKAFSQFEIEKTIELGLNLTDFKQILKRTPLDSSINLKKQDNLLKIEIAGFVKKTFNLGLINVQAEEKKIPELNFNSVVEMPASTFMESVNDCIVIADSCNFNASENFFSIEAKGIVNSAAIELTGDEIKVQSKEKSKAKYSLDYLTKFAKASKIAEKLIIYFSNDYPARLDFLSNQGAQISFILAPRIEEE